MSWWQIVLSLLVDAALGYFLTTRIAMPMIDARARKVARYEHDIARRLLA